MAVFDAAASERGDGRARPETPPATATLTPSSRNVVASLADVDVGEAADLLALTRQP